MRGWERGTVYKRGHSATWQIHAGSGKPTFTSEQRVIDVERENVKTNPGALSWKQVPVCTHSFQYERENLRCRNVRYVPAYRVRVCE